MSNFTSNTYTLKRKILTFTNKISRKLSKPERKFTADITYGMLASGSCLLTDVCDQLHEPSKKINVVDRLSRHLEKGTPAFAASAYLQQVKKWVPAEPVIHIDDSDIVKPDGYKFEALGIVRDGSESTSTKNIYKKGYHVTEACVLTSGNHPISIFSKIHSSQEKDYKSANTITFQAMELGAALFRKATFAMDKSASIYRIAILKLSKKGRLMFRKVIFISELHFAETQAMQSIKLIALLKILVFFKLSIYLILSLKLIKNAKTGTTIPFWRKVFSHLSGNLRNG